MTNRNRREFLSNVGRGMLAASVGPALVADLGLAPAFGRDSSETLSFGAREPLVALLQETPADKLLPLLVSKIQSGTDLQTLTAACALANARTFGGEDYTGYHAFMALAPAYHMTSELPAERRALPVLKVLYRNVRRIQEFGGRSKEVLHAVTPAELPKDRPVGEMLREAAHGHDATTAERTLAALVNRSTKEAFDELQHVVDDDADVHRVVLAWRAWAMLDIVGQEQATTLLRQSVRFCSHTANERRQAPAIRALLPKLLDQYKLVGRPLGTRTPDDAWVERMSRTIYESNGSQAADAVAAALADGISPEAIGEAISLAANMLVLRDAGLTETQVSPGKPVGSVHGASIGVHASDAVNAWRNIARVGNARTTAASLIVAAYYKTGAAGLKSPHPLAEQLEAVRAKDADSLLRETALAIESRDQPRACALIHRYGELGHPPRPVFDLMLKYAVSEDGALHAEKYYRTVEEEFAATRPAFRWRQLVALARVTASEFGNPAPGYAEACRLLKV
ncbi:MAG: hypothetical protein U0746_05805 [Gemmataceae bacterium]